MRACLLALTLLLVGAASANAAVTHRVEGNTLTVTGDDADNAIVLSVEGGELAVNGEETGLGANPDARIVVDTLAGADTVDAGPLLAEQYASLAFTGGPGGDRLTGGERSDLLVWNEGDGNDTATGGAGNDGVQVNGSAAAADVFSFRPIPGGLARVVLARTAPTPFELDFEAERMEVKTFGGGDRIAPDAASPMGIRGRTEPILRGGDGSDQITGGNGIDELHGEDDPDAIDGGDGPDVIFGGAGSDLLEGGADEDALIGGEGDDSVVWFDGDGNDLAFGEAGFDRLRVEGSVTGGDRFQLGGELGTTTLQRTNLTPFAIDLPDVALAGAERSGGIELVSVVGGGGDDALTVSPGLGHLQVSANGGTGDDELRGAEEVDGFLGGPGKDTLVPGPGEDLADGQEGEDSLFTRDGAVDVVRGGPDRDSAQTDLLTVDVVSEVEDLNGAQPPPPPPPPTPRPVQPPPAQLPSPPVADNVALLPKLGRAALAKSGRKLVAKLPLSCPAEEAGGCQTTLTVKTTRGGTTLGSKTVRLAAGNRATATIPVPRAARLARNGKLPVRIRVATADAAGNTATRTVAAVLKLPR